MPRQTVCSGNRTIKCVSTRNRRLDRRLVKRMFLAMEASSHSRSSKELQSPTNEPMDTQEFLSSGRTGRRNALPDILSQHAVMTTTSNLTARLESLGISTTGSSTSNTNGPASCESNRNSQQ